MFSMLSVPPFESGITWSTLRVILGSSLKQQGQVNLYFSLSASHSAKVCVPPLPSFLILLWRLCQSLFWIPPFHKGFSSPRYLPLWASLSFCRCSRVSFVPVLIPGLPFFAWLINARALTHFSEVKMCKRQYSDILVLNRTPHFPQTGRVLLHVVCFLHPLFQGVFPLSFDPAFR